MLRMVKIISNRANSNDVRCLLCLHVCMDMGIHYSTIVISSKVKRQGHPTDRFGGISEENAQNMRAYYTVAYFNTVTEK